MRLLKREIGTVSTMTLNMRYCRILEQGETMDAKDIPVADAREILWIEDELRKRVIKGIGHDFYPPDRVEKEHPSNYMISILKPTEPKPEPKSGAKIKFNVAVTSSIGSKAANFRVEADSKPQAEILAQRQIRKLGLQGANYKIS